MGKIRGKSGETKSVGNLWEIKFVGNQWEDKSVGNQWEDKSVGKFPTIFLLVGKPWELLNGRGKIRGKTFPTPLLTTAKIRGKSDFSHGFPTDLALGNERFCSSVTYHNNNVIYS